MICPACDDELWVCEAHPDRPWGDGDRECRCGAAGMPCPICNVPEPGEMPKAPPGSVEIWRAPYAPPMR